MVQSHLKPIVELDKPQDFKAAARAAASPAAKTSLGQCRNFGGLEVTSPPSDFGSEESPPPSFLPRVVVKP